jgi:hypothetical protein
MFKAVELVDSVALTKEDLKVAQNSLEEDKRNKILAKKKLEQIKNQHMPHVSDSRQFQPMPQIYFKSQEKMIRSESPEIAKYIDMDKVKDKNVEYNFDDFDE